MITEYKSPCMPTVSAWTLCTAWRAARELPLHASTTTKPYHYSITELVYALLKVQLETGRKFAMSAVSKSGVLTNGDTTPFFCSSAPLVDFEYIILNFLSRCAVKWKKFCCVRVVCWQTNDALVAPLLRLKDNSCHVDESERVLKDAHKYSELVILYEKKGLHNKGQ